MKAKLFSGITLLALFGVVSSANSQEGFLYSGGNYTTLDVPGSTDTILRGINNSGQIVGDYSANNVRSGVFYSEGIFTTLNLPVTSDSTIATGINNFGQIVGSYGPASGNNRDVPLFVELIGQALPVDEAMRLPSSPQACLWSCA